MAEVKLKNGETVQLDLNDLEEFLNKYGDQIEVQHTPMDARRQPSRRLPNN